MTRILMLLIACMTAPLCAGDLSTGLAMRQFAWMNDEAATFDVFLAKKPFDGLPRQARVVAADVVCLDVTRPFRYGVLQELVRRDRFVAVIECVMGWSSCCTNVFTCVFTDRHACILYQEGTSRLWIEHLCVSDRQRLMVGNLSQALEKYKYFRRGPKTASRPLYAYVTFYDGGIARNSYCLDWPRSFTDRGRQWFSAGAGDDDSKRAYDCFLGVMREFAERIRAIVGQSTVLFV